MKFERSVRVRTPDGVDHENVAAAERHMFALNFGILGNATSMDFENAVANPTTEDETLIGVRNAIRDVFLAAWPRANKGKPREAKAPEETTTEETTTDEGSSEPIAEFEQPPPPAHAGKRKGR